MCCDAATHGARAIEKTSVHCTSFPAGWIVDHFGSFLRMQPTESLAIGAKMLPGQAFYLSKKATKSHPRFVRIRVETLVRHAAAISVFPCCEIELGK
jgi:hypothetical protein